MKQPSQTELDDEIYDLAPCGFFTARPDGLILKANHTFAAMIGYEEDAILNRIRWQNLLTMGGKIYHETHFLPLLRMQGHVKEVSFDLKKKDGSLLPVLVNSTQCRGETEQTFLDCFSVLDITQRKLYEKELLFAKRKADELVERLQTLNTELEQFAYIVSHDLQSPLTAISGFTQLLRMKLGPTLDAQSDHMFEKIEDSTNNMSNFIKEILDYSKLEHKAEHHEPVDLNEVWERVKGTFELGIKENNATIIVPKLPVVKGNQVQLIRLFQNLLSNSLKYRSDRDPVIEIVVREEGNSWNFLFKDNGIGFSQSDAARIFKFFQRLNNSKGAVSGIGIGLAVTKRIVELHGGTIEGFSEPGEGATFAFSFPVYTPE